VKRSAHPEEVALFPKKYDWKEDRRVQRALDHLYRDTSVELWEECVKRTKDARYCLTLTSPVNDDAHNFSVGSILHNFAKDRLRMVFEQHLPVGKGRPRYYRVGVKDLAKWRMERKDKPLYELQIEVCEKALVELARDARFSKAQKNQAQQKIDAKIKKLRETKRAFVYRFEEFDPGFWGCGYDAELARRAREAIKTGSSFDINK
jgi:hypothetical protein